MRIIILGCGSSSGVPVIGCSCATCLSDNPRNKRTRASILIEIEGKRLLVDTSPDLRQQALREGITKVDAIIYTHDHADHTHGIDDTRSFNYHKDGEIEAFADAPTLAALQQKFPYAFRPRPDRVWYRPSLTLREIPSNPYRIFNVLGIDITPIPQQHGAMGSLGFRIENTAYCTDVKEFSPASWALLEGVDTWIIDCLRPTPSHTHSTLEATLEWIRQLKPKRAILTHMAHELEYGVLKQMLPHGVEPAYDGMVIESD